LLFINKSDTAQQAQVSTEGGFLPPINPWPGVQMNLSAYSIVVLTLHRNGGAESYNFVTPGDGHSTPPLVHIICGNQGTALANGTAC
jgi:hypothetical protein